MSRTIVLIFAYISCISFVGGFDRRKALNDLESILDDDVLAKLTDILKEKREVVIFKCEDDPRTASSCPHWKLGGACKRNKVTMQRYCRKTCNDCRQPSPRLPKVPPCASAQYGCCWDNRTEALGPTEDITQSQCRPCQNRQSKTFCTNWKMDCNSKVVGQGDVMRHLCPQTCGVPCDYNLNIHKCKDDPANAQNCIMWLQDGKCTSDQQTMRVLCPAACGFCYKGK